MIDKQTALFSLIGESAIESKKAKLFNDFFSDMGVNAKMMPLNIRMDDIGFFLYNFKNSQIKAAIFQKEYRKIVCSLLDEVSQEAKICGIVDTLDVSDGNNKAYLTQGRAALSLLDVKDKSIGIYGNTPSIKSIIYHLNSSDAKEIVLYDDVIERTLELSKLVSDLNVDIVRVEGDVIKSNVDIFIDDRGDCELKSDALVLDLTQEEEIENRLTFYDVEKAIAKIKTKEWIENG